ncbi:3D domain-containing protein [Halobacillus seohaensis]|uniref:3D domain-containing protein n=1 Tax=Halobacillus seohaensis TaxID=447421 RepID=A0ABW2ENJ9_9BACI
MTQIFKRILLFILFVGAIYSTWLSISNLSLKDVNDWITLKELTKSEESGEELTLTNTSSESAATSASINKDSLEDILNLSEFPRYTVTATGYTAGHESTGKHADHPAFGITYSGVEVKRDLYSTIAADLEIFPLGTVLFIPGYGYGVVADTGSAIKGDKIDLYYPSVEDVYNQWGKKEIDVFVIEEGDGTLREKDLIYYNDNEALEVFRNEILGE